MNPTPAKPEHETTPGYVALEGEVAKRRELGLEHDATPRYYREPESIGDLIGPALAQLKARRNITDEDVLNAEKEIERMDMEGTDERFYCFWITNRT